MISKLKRIILLKHVQIGVITILCIFVYLPLLSFQFVYDDVEMFQGWNTPRSFTNFPSFFNGVLPGGQMDYRPFRTVLYAISYATWKNNPLGIHLQALLLNLIIAIIVYFISLKITENTLISFSTSLLFGLHPAHTEAITWATASMDTFGLGFALFSFYLFLISKKMYSWKFFLSVIFAFFAFMTYEITLILPVLFGLYIFCFEREKFKKKKNMLLFLPYICAIVIYIFMRLFFIRGEMHTSVSLNNQMYYTFVAESKLFYQYFSILVFPVNLSLNHEISDQISSFRAGPAFYSQPFLDIHNSVSFLLIAFLLILFVKTLKKVPLISFCVGWFFIGLIPVLNIIPIQTIFAERFVFLSSFGYCLFLAFILIKPFKSKKKFVTVLLSLRPYIFIIIIMSYILLTLLRNQDWKSNFTLWEKTTEQTPDSARAWTNLGTAYMSINQNDLAMKYELKAIKLEPTFPFSHENLGLIYYRKKQYAKALSELAMAVKYDPKNELYIRIFNIALAKAQKTTTMQNQNNVLQMYITQEVSLIHKGNIDGAISLLENALQQFPNNMRFLNDLAILYYSKGNIDKTISLLKKSIAIDPTNPVLYVNLGRVYESQGKYDLAQEAYQTSLNLDPQFQQAKNALQILDSKKL